MSYIKRISEAYHAVQLDDRELQYVARHILLPDLGLIGQRKLKAARVLVVGAGGLGCPLLQGLCGAGVGRITVVDGDVVAMSNLSRQWLHSFTAIGQNKAMSAVETLQTCNPLIELRFEPVYLQEGNASALVEAHDIIVDATDTFEARYLIDRFCADLDRPWVHGALFRQVGQVSTFWDSCGARFIKLYPEEANTVSCSGAGMLGSVSSIIGHWQALEVIKLIVGYANPAVGKVLSFDARTLQTTMFSFPGVVAPVSFEDSSSSKESSLSLSLEQALQHLSIGESINWVDLRSTGAHMGDAFEAALQVSVDELLASEVLLSEIKQPVLICEEGTVSRLIAEAMQAKGVMKVRYLEGGYQAWTAGL